MAEKIENHITNFLTIMPNHKAENYRKAKPTEYSGKSGAYWYISPKIVLTSNSCDKANEIEIDKFIDQKGQFIDPFPWYPHYLVSNTSISCPLLLIKI